ncbi:hypothetical protein BCR34DRAFT_636965 [Clohesyomyces aquaticus]|uniref:Ribonucleases P/MRP subunit Pop8-like domain-containing protein n=1 Tax=Clohesyomyces aquaticus TaxID=1231657 RepID=A0A1Y1YTZ4_9PLEO|nr:hypothetical protein BCR34DRAFT_636965 [Clohesyomyces aquaticus]
MAPFRATSSSTRPPNSNYTATSTNPTLPRPTNSAIPNPSNDTFTAADPTPNSDGDGVKFTPSSSSKKRKRKEKPHVLHQSTFKKPLWTYLHLCLITPGTVLQPPSTSTSSSTTGPSPLTPSIDALTSLSLLTHALTAFLGLAGSSIPLDILKTLGRELWIRVPRQDARGLRAALSTWTGWCEADLIPGLSSGTGGGGGKGKMRVAWRVLGSTEALGGLVGGGEDLFGG